MVARVAILGRPLDELRYRCNDTFNPGDVVRVPLGQSETDGCVVSLEESPEEGLKEVAGLLAPCVFPKSSIQLASHIARYHIGFLGEALALVLPRDILRPPRTEITRASPQKNSSSLTLRPDEAELYERFRQTSKPLKPLLVHSDADYTAFLVRTALDTLDRGRQVTFILPTEPELGRFVNRFSSYLPLTIYQADMGQGERRRVWHGVRQGKVRLVAGMRSAVLLPFTEPGLFVVLDCESEAHRVRSHHLHYHARDIALYRSEKESSRIILFSLAPSLELSHRARTGKLTLVERKVTLKGRAVVVDLGNQEKDKALSQPLKEELVRTYQKGMQSVLLLNRLGTAGRLMCLDCGLVLSCPDCGVPLKFMKPGRDLVCFMCGKHLPAPQDCPGCGGARWQTLSVGLEGLDKELRTLLPRARLCRITGEDRPRLEAAERAEVIYGTSAVLEYYPSRVRLAAFLSWDAERSRADFRSSEQAFRDVIHIKRMLGSGPRSKLIVQTFRPRDVLLRQALVGDYESFFQGEVRRRRELGYPPYHRLILFARTRSRKALKPEELMANLTRDGVELLGPYPGPGNRTCVLAKLRRDLAPQDLISAAELYKSGWQAGVDPVEVV